MTCTCYNTEPLATVIRCRAAIQRSGVVLQYRGQASSRMVAPSRRRHPNPLSMARAIARSTDYRGGGRRYMCAVCQLLGPRRRGMVVSAAAPGGLRASCVVACRWPQPPRLPKLTDTAGHRPPARRRYPAIPSRRDSPRLNFQSRIRAILMTSSPISIQQVS